jgi:hypothetical protein
LLATVGSTITFAHFSVDVQPYFIDNKRSFQLGIPARLVGDGWLYYSFTFTHFSGDVRLYFIDNKSWLHKF